uniref:Uncharacterized protein n=1 Tax=Arundo donax TaxID=35708 RepID=A0A0A9HIB1_ARUDO
MTVPFPSATMDFANAFSFFLCIRLLALRVASVSSRTL